MASVSVAATSGVLQRTPASLTKAFLATTKGASNMPRTIMVRGIFSCSFVLLTVHSFCFPNVTVGWLQRTRAGGASPPIQQHLPVARHLTCEHLRHGGEPRWPLMHAPCQPACAGSKSVSCHPLRSHSPLCFRSCRFGSVDSLCPPAQADSVLQHSRGVWWTKHSHNTQPRHAAK